MVDCLGRAMPGAEVASRRARLLVLLLVLPLIQASAQTAVDGAIRGVALNQAAAAVAGAVVHVRDTTRGLNFTTVCDGHGSFVLAHTPAGSYDVTIAAPGFATLTLDRVAVEAGGTTDLAIRLKLAGLQTLVTVTDEDAVANLDQPSGAALSTTVTSGA
jgi:hypothetical protein